MTRKYRMIKFREIENMVLILSRIVADIVEYKIENMVRGYGSGWQIS